MNETIKCILNRKSIRAYTDEAVSQDDIEIILNCGIKAATAMNKQPWHFTVVRSRIILDKISAKNKEILLNSPDPNIKEMASDPNFDSFRGAPMAVIVSGINEEQMTIADCANATQNMAVAATSLGLGSCYIASFKISLNHPDGKTLLDELNIPNGYTPMFALSIGHCAEDPQPKERNMDVFNYID